MALQIKEKMKAPISWINEYTKINLPLKKLMWRMTEAGLTTESWEKVEADKVLDIEVTPNRPDWLSIVGVAREISVIQQSPLKLPKLPEVPKPKKDLPISVRIASKLVGRYTGVTIADIKVKDSPAWMQKRLKLIGLRPINNLVDITNYVMFELGLPIHVFDYDKFLINKLSVELTKGGEKFTSVDGINYKLPKNAIIIKDKDRVIDLAAIKGGENTGIAKDTKNIFIHIPIYDPAATRKTSQKMKLSSDASYIYERGPDPGGTLDVLKRTVDLTLKLSGGKVASKIIDIKSQEYVPQKLSLSYKKLISTLGVDVSKDKTISILKSLNLSPKIDKDTINCLIPTYRSDLRGSEDLIEEVARIYRYSKFPKTLPSGTHSKNKIPYKYDRSFELKLKYLISATGFVETNTLALTSKEVIKKSQLNLDNHIKIANPVSREYEYLRTSLIPSLLQAIKLNANEDRLKLFEYNKVYFAPVDKAEEPYKIAAVLSNKKYRLIKEIFDTLIERLNIQKSLDIKPSAVKKGLWHPTKSGVIEAGNDALGTIGFIHPKVLANFEIKGEVLAFELSVAQLKKLIEVKKYQPIPTYPPQIEDITLKLPAKTKIGSVIYSIKAASKLISNVKFVDSYESAYTFKIHYQHPKKTLTDKEVTKIRDKIFNRLKITYKVRVK